MTRRKAALVGTVCFGGLTPFRELAGSVRSIISGQHAPWELIDHPENISLNEVVRGQPEAIRLYVRAQLLAPLPSVIIGQPDIWAATRAKRVSGNVIFGPRDFPDLLTVTDGWTPNEEWGTWSNGDSVRLVLPMFCRTTPAVQVLRYAVHKEGGVPGTTTRLRSHGHFLAEWAYTRADFDRRGQIDN
jgi:hypothetical protein